MKLFISSLSGGTTPVSIPIKTSVIIDNTRWTVAVKDNKHLSITGTLLELSVNNGSTWTSSLNQSWVARVERVFVFNDDSFLMLTNQAEIFHVTSDLSSSTERFVSGVTISNPDHTYFNTFSLQNRWSTPALYVWGNYTLDTGEVNVYYTSDNGATVKVALDFGTTIPETPRHVHSVEYNKYDDTWMVVTGDDPTVGVLTEGTHWHVGTYNDTLDSWSWSTLDFKDNLGASFQIIRPSRLKCNSTWFGREGGETYIYWGAETNGNTAAERGYWKCKYSEFEDMTKHVRMFDFTAFDGVGEFKVNSTMLNENTGYIISMVATEGVSFSGSKILIAKDYGNGDWEMREFASGYVLTGHSVPDSNGYYRFDTVFQTAAQTKTIFIKPGSDLWDGYEETII
jgi:hypothetical protein